MMEISEVPNTTSTRLQQQQQPDDRSELELVLEQIKGREHPDVKTKREVLLKIKEKRMHAIEVLKREHIKSISELYDFEKEETNAIFKRDMDEYIESLCATARSEYFKVQLLKAGTANPTLRSTSAGARISSRHGHAADGSEDVLAGNGHGGNNGNNGNSNSNSNSNSKGSGGHSTHGNAKSSNGHGLNGSSGANKRKLYTSTLTFEKALPESEIRGDFVEIVQDLETRARRFSDFNSKAILVDVVVYRAGVPLVKHQSSSDSEDPSKYLGVDLAGNRIADGVLIGSIYFPIGCLVKVHSKYSNEELHGVLSTISESELVCRCGSGVKFKVRIEHVVCGRLQISQSEECYEAIQVMRDAAKAL